jgi:protein involved in polysaccharide export with SLBB domain
MIFENGMPNLKGVMSRNVLLRTAVSGLLIATFVRGAGAQGDPPSTSRSEFETRAELEQQARVAEQQHRTSEAWLLRTRLEKGDFQEGDRIVVMVHSSAAQKPIDTVVVRAGKILQMPKMDDMSLEGVLRSELTDRFSKYLGKYLQDSLVRATPLVRVGVFGRVAAPGFYYVAADVVLNDVIMRAGGPSGDADLGKVRVERAGSVIWNETESRTALAEGLSLDRLHLRAGDDVYVGEQRHIQWLTLFSVTIGLASLAIAIFRR